MSGGTESLFQSIACWMLFLFAAADCCLLFAVTVVVDVDVVVADTVRYFVSSWLNGHGLLLVLNRFFFFSLFLGFLCLLL